MRLTFQSSGEASESLPPVWTLGRVAFRPPPPTDEQGSLLCPNSQEEEARGLLSVPSHQSVMMTSRESSDWEDWDSEPVRKLETAPPHQGSSKRNSFHFIVTSPSPTSLQEDNSYAVAYAPNSLAIPGASRRRRNENDLWPDILRLNWKKGSVLAIVGLFMIAGYGAAENWKEERIAWFAGAKTGWQDLGIEITTLPGPSPVVRMATSSTLDGATTLPRATAQATSSTLDHPPRFIFPGRIGEQETKAQLHLYQLGLLALILNRTLVLPNVQKSRMGACYSHPFDLYYESGSLEQLGVPTISQDDFTRWTEGQQETPLAQIISMVTSKGAVSHQIQIDPRDDSVLHKAMCTSRASMDFEAYEPLIIHPPDGRTVSERIHTTFARELKSTIEAGTGRKWKLGTEPDVLMFDYNLRYRLLSPSVVTALDPSALIPFPYTYFPYSSEWENLGKQLTSSLSPFIAIHWRIETLPASNLFPCGEALVEQLKRLEDRFPQLNTVYLATDYPLELLGPADTYSDGGGEKVVAHSSTLTKELTEEHHNAMRSFLTAFNEKVGGLKLTSFLQEEPSLELPASLRKTGESVEEVDPALIGFIDKIVMTQAEIFIAGEPGRHNCAKSSSFTEQVIEGRIVIQDEQKSSSPATVKGDINSGWKGPDGRPRKGKLWNTVSHFGVGELQSDEFLDSDW